MRDLLDIKRDIDETQLKLARLRREQRGVFAIWKQRIIDAFDAGMSLRDVAEQTNIPFPKVQGVLYRAGRTEQGRAKVREQVARAVGSRQDEQTAAAP